MKADGEAVLPRADMADGQQIRAMVDEALSAISAHVGDAEQAHCCARKAGKAALKRPTAIVLGRLLANLQ
ncbi:MAG: hypothetical protein U9O18_02270 [Chloroflexota bacterium]|nr:hypothetical protein [Chloroflexota bacterium]